MRFHFDSALCRIIQQLDGFLSLDEAEAVHRDVSAACARVRDGGGTLAVLVDYRHYPVQSQAVSTVGERIAAEYAATPLAGFAAVTGSAMQRVRLRRVLEAVRPSFFENPAEAVDRLGWARDWPPLRLTQMGDAAASGASAADRLD